MVTVKAETIASGQVCKMQCGCAVRALDEFVERCLPGVNGNNASSYITHRKFSVLAFCDNEPKNCDLHTDERMTRMAEIENNDYGLYLDPLVSALYDEFECAA